jgi:hypothetical protein
MAIIRAMIHAAAIKINRGIPDFVADRIVIAATESTVLKFVERLGSLLDVQLEYVGGARVAAFMSHINDPDATAVLVWLREYPRVAAMIAYLKDDADYDDAVANVRLKVADKKEMGRALSVPQYDIPITITCESPLSHGSDTKAGNATIFRRMQILSDTGSVLNLPFYAGNAVRGEMRDRLADHYLRSLGIDSSKSHPGVQLWFFYSLYSGGKLESMSAEERALSGELGTNGAQKTEGINRLRNMVPPLSILGCALGNRVIPGRLNFADFRPRCAEWGTSERPSAELMEWTYLTRREDYEGHESGENTSMIVNVETLRAGTVLDGGIDVSMHMTKIEQACFAKGLQLLMEHGYIGADNRRGMGKVKFDFAAMDSAPYDQYLADNKDQILEYLKTISALIGEAQ